MSLARFAPVGSRAARFGSTNMRTVAVKRNQDDFNLWGLYYKFERDRTPESHYVPSFINLQLYKTKEAALKAADKEQCKKCIDGYIVKVRKVTLVM